MYYITICTHNREKILSKIISNMDVGNDALVVPQQPFTYLTKIGEEIERSILNIELKNKNIYIEDYIIMPDHIHLIININTNYNIDNTYTKNVDINKERRGRRSLQGLIKDFKSVTTRKYGKKLWQKSYYEHIIRNEKEYYQIYNYIRENPLRYILKNKL